MKLFGLNINKEPIQKIITSFPSRHEFSLLGSSSDSDFEISDDYKGYEKAYREQVWVQRCINLLASSVASVPLKLVKLEDDKKEEVKTHPILTLLSDVNPLNMNASDLWKATIIDLKVYGNAYWYLERKGGSEPKEIYRLYPAGMQIKNSENVGEYINGYRYATNNPKAPFIDYSVKDIIHFKYFNPTNEFYGLSPLSSIRGAISADLYAEAWNKYFFKNVTRLDGVFIFKEGLDPDVRERVKKELEAHFKGTKKHGQTPVIEADMEYKQLSTIPKDAEWSQLRTMSREAICSALGVPPVLVVATDASSYATAFEQKKSLWHETIIPEVQYLYEVLNWSLLPQFAKSEGLRIEPDYTNIIALQEEASNAYARLFQATGVPFLTREEARQSLGYSSVPKEGALFEPLNMVNNEPKTDNLDEIPVETETATNKPTGDTAANIASGEKLNGIQITASADVINRLIMGNIPKEVALELLVAVGIDEDRAKKMVSSCNTFTPKNPELLNRPQQ